MKRLLLALALLFAPLAALAQPLIGYGPGSPPGTGGSGGGGSPVYITPTTNSVGAAGANTTLIQNAVNTYDAVIIQCTAPFYINATIYQPSNSAVYIENPACVPTAASGTGSMWQNVAMNDTLRPWTVTQKNATGTAGPFSVIWAGSTPAWVTGTVYAQSASANLYVTSNSNIYWLATSSCTSGATPPSGTGSPSDGACTWNYVTTDNQSPNSTLMTATVYWPAHGRSVGDIAWLTPEPDGISPASWAATTSYLPLQVKKNGANLYVEIAPLASCTSAGSGGPTGTGTNIVDNTCTWNYMSLAASPNRYWSGAETGQGAVGGLADSAYFGPFPITAINDANNVTVLLHRQPSTAFSGIPMWVKQGDVNIILKSAAIWDHNYPTNNPLIGNGQYDLSSQMTYFGGVQNLLVDGLGGKNVANHVIVVDGVSTYTLNNIVGGAPVPGRNYERVKVYGPSFDGVIQNISGTASDDIISIHSEAPPSFPFYTAAVGDILDTHIRHVTGSGYEFVTYLDQPYLVTDGTELEDINVATTVLGTHAPIAISNEMSANWPTVTLGSWHIKGAMSFPSAQCLVKTYTNNGLSILQDIELEDVESNWKQSSTLNAGATGCLADFGTGITVNNLVLDNVRVELQSSATAYAGAPDMVVRAATATTTINNTTVKNSWFNATTANTGYLIYNAGSSGTFKHVTVEDSYFNNLNAVVRYFQVMDIGLYRDYIACTSACTGIVPAVAGGTIHVSGNWFNNGGNGLIRYPSAQATTIYSGGDNIMAGSGSILIGNPGAANANLAGSLFVNLADLAAITAPTVSNCGGTTTPVSGSTELAGTVALPAAQLSCQINFVSNTVPVAPKNCNFVAPQTTIVSGGCTVSWTSATSGFITLGVSANVAGETIGYGVSP